MEMQKLKMRKQGNAKVENAETWKCEMYFVMSRLGHRTVANLAIALFFFVKTNGYGH
jgi:hypothetical protein